MPEHASRAAALFDQFEDQPRIADWGGDELFTRMPRPRAVDDAPPPRFRPRLAPSDAVANEPRRPASAPGARPGPAARRRLALVEPHADERRAAERHTAPDDHPGGARSGDEAMRERAERLGLSVV